MGDLLVPKDPQGLLCVRYAAPVCLIYAEFEFRRGYIVYPEAYYVISLFFSAFGKYEGQPSLTGYKRDALHPSPFMSVTAKRRSASATNSPFTLATALTLHILGLAFVMFISITSWSPGTTGFLKRALSMPKKNGIKPSLSSFDNIFYFEYI